MGAMANLTTLALAQNMIGDPGLSALSEALAIGAMAHLTTLKLYSNQIGDVGVSSLADACAKGALASLESLDLGCNYISDTGLTALASACARESLSVCVLDPSLRKRWPNNYGVWLDEVEPLGYQDCCDVVWTEADVVFEDAAPDALSNVTLRRPRGAEWHTPRRASSSPFADASVSPQSDERSCRP